jgi:hypothetical protein
MSKISGHSGTKLEIDEERIGKSSQILGTQTTHFTLHMWVKEKKKTREILKYFNPNKNKNTTYQAFWFAVKAVLRRKLITPNAYIIKEYPKSII